MRSALLVIAIAGLGTTRSARADGELPDPSIPSRSAQLAVTVLNKLGDDTPAPAVEQLGLVGFRAGGLAGDRVIGAHASLDAAIGGQFGRHGGLAYDVGVLPLGLGARLGPDAYVALDLGLAAMGATGSVDDAILVPLQLELEAGSGIHVMVRARASFVLGADGRRDGAPSLPFGDELEGALGIRVGRADVSKVPMGYYVAAAYKEWQGTRYLGLAVGYALGGD